MKHIKPFEAFITESEKVNLILLPIAGGKYRIESKKDSELGITGSLSDVKITEILDKKYGKEKWFKKVTVEKEKEAETRKALDDEYNNGIVKESFELKEIDGEWAIVGNFSKLFGKKADLEKIIGLLKESEDALKEFKVEAMGMKGQEYHLKINGHEYAYVAKEGSELTIQQIGEKFVKILKYSGGRALNWLKKQTTLVKGDKVQENIELFFLDNLFESKDDIDDMAIDMLDFYGGELPSSYQECEDYLQAREMDIDTLKDVYITAQMLQNDTDLD